MLAVFTSSGVLRFRRIEQDDHCICCPMPGTIGGMAGKASLDLIKRGLGVGKGTLELMVPGFVWRSALLSAATYYYTVYWAGQISSEEGRPWPQCR